MVVGVMPVQCALAGVVALELGQQAAAVDVQLGLEREPGEVEHRGEKIHADHWLVRHAAGLGDTGGADERGFSDAAFVKPAFAGPERQIAAGADAAKRAEAAVVAEKNNHRVVIQLKFLEFIEQCADAVIDGRDH